MINVSVYNKSLFKRFIDIVISLFLLISISPFLLATAVVVFIFSGYPIFYLQPRVGKNGKVFKVIKFRTMIVNASKYQNKYRKYNEADGPVFKIYNDPRFTKIGRYLSRLGIDELPQLINVLKGDMSLVGPRPLPVNEAKRLESKYKIRELIRPGITSLWVVNGSHKMKFKKWMALDKYYVKNSSFFGDFIIILKTILVVLRLS